MSVYARKVLRTCGCCGWVGGAGGGWGMRERVAEEEVLGEMYCKREGWCMSSEATKVVKRKSAADDPTLLLP